MSRFSQNQFNQFSLHLHQIAEHNSRTCTVVYGWKQLHSKKEKGGDKVVLTVIRLESNLQYNSLKFYISSFLQNSQIKRPHVFTIQLCLRHIRPMQPVSTWLALLWRRHRSETGPEEPIQRPVWAVRSCQTIKPQSEYIVSFNNK